MDENTRRKIYAALAAPFPESCIQRTEGKLTGRGYDTTGIGYQHIVNRLNEVLGIGGFRAHRTVTVKEVKRSNGRPAFEAICDLTLELGQWVDGNFVVFAESLADGGHIASSEADARKGAFTNAFKKGAAFHGVGKAAYEGTLDDDNLPEDGAAPFQATTTVVRAPVPAAPAAVDTTPPGFTRTATAAEVRSQVQERNRLSSKQLAAIWSIARKLGVVEQSSFRSQVKTKFGCQLEFLSRQQASELITTLNAQLHNGGEHHEQQPDGAA
ncbi:MAG: hypothetical protein IAE78_32700 [Myxococcus sp.]|nr:hypothetical protein [Myxococcus sp.]